MNILAIIPARANSKGIVRKNLSAVAGEPLIAWTIRQALAAPSINRVVVSTDGEEIAAVARAHGADVPFLRPAEISTDTASTEEAMVHAVEELSKLDYRPDYVVLLQATCPIRRPGSVEAAIRLLFDTQSDSVVSAQEIHPFLWQRPNDAVAQYDFRNRPRRQDISQDDRLYEENGSIYITRTDILLRDRCRLGGKIAIHPMSSAESIDIDTVEDIVLAEAIIKSLGIT